MDQISLHLFTILLKSALIDQMPISSKSALMYVIIPNDKKDQRIKRTILSFDRTCTYVIIPNDKNILALMCTFYKFMKYPCTYVIIPNDIEKISDFLEFKIIEDNC